MCWCSLFNAYFDHSSMTMLVLVGCKLCKRVFLIRVCGVAIIRNYGTKVDTGSNSTSSANSIASNGGKDDGLDSIPKFLEAFGSQSPTSLASKIYDIESKMLQGKLVLLRKDGKPLKPSDKALNIAGTAVVREDCEIKLVKGNAHLDQHTKPISYEDIISPNAIESKVNFLVLHSNVRKDSDFDVGILKTSQEKVNERLKTPLYGYFIGKG
ncbi:hypothetical protein Tco_1208258 [Tanacetum coccineum]